MDMAGVTFTVEFTLTDNTKSVITFLASKD